MTGDFSDVNERFLLCIIADGVGHLGKMEAERLATSEAGGEEKERQAQEREREARFRKWADGER